MDRTKSPVDTKKLRIFLKELTKNPEIKLNYLKHGDYGICGDCIWNVERYIKTYGGEKVRGWMVFKRITDKEVFYEAIFHYVVRLQDGTLKCVTKKQDDDDDDKYCFVIDDRFEITINGDECTGPRSKIAMCKSPQEIFYGVVDPLTRKTTLFSDRKYLMETSKYNIDTTTE